MSNYIGALFISHRTCGVMIYDAKYWYQDIYTYAYIGIKSDSPCLHRSIRDMGEKFILERQSRARPAAKYPRSRAQSCGSPIPSFVSFIPPRTVLIFK